MRILSRQYIAQFIVVLIGYFLAARLGMWPTPLGDYASLVWPAAGIAVAAMILCGLRIWPAIALGNIAFLVSIGHSDFGVMLIAPIGPVIGAAVGAYVLTRALKFRPDFPGTRHVFTFIVVGTVCTALVSACIGVSARLAIGATTWSGCAEEWGRWFLGDSIGALLIAPFILVWSDRIRSLVRMPEFRLPGARMLGEFVLALLVLGFITGVAFLNWFGAASLERHLAYAPVPVLIWLAMRFAMPGATLGVFLLATIACIGTVLGKGPFGDPDDLIGLAMLWSYVAILGMTFYFMGAVVEDRRRSAHALQQSEEQYRRIIETAREGVWVIDSQGVTTFANKRMGEILGYDVDELIGHSMYEFMSEEACAEAAANLERRRQGVPEQHEFCFRHRNGSDVWTLLATNPLFDRKGKMIGALAMVSDISDRKQVEQAVEHLAEDVSSVTDDAFFESLVLNLAEATSVTYAYVGLLDDERRRVQTLAACRNGELIEGFDYELESAPCHNVVDRQLFIHVSDVRDQFPDDARLRELQIEGYAGVPLADSKGTTFGVLVCMHTEPLPEPELTGHLLRVFGMRCAAELERKKAEQSLLDSEERYRTLVEAAPIPILVHVDERIAFVNPSAAEVLGADTAEELLGLPIWDILHPDYHDMVRDRLEYVERGHRDAPVIPERFLRRDGTPIDVEVMASRTRYLGRPAMQAVFRDISERLKAEDALRESERRNRSIVSSLAEGITLYDTEGRLIAHNESAIRILGLDPNELADRELTDADWQIIRGDGTMFATDDLPANQTLRSGRPMHDVLMGIRRQSGALRWLSINTQPIFGEDEVTPMAVVVSFSDITAQREAVEVLELQREVLNQIATGADLKRVLSRLCQLVERSIVNSHCCAAVPENDTSRISIIAPPSAADGWHEALKRIIATDGGSAWSRAIESARIPIVAATGESEELAASLQELARECGHESCWMVPVRSEGQEVRGLLLLFRSEDRAPTGFEEQVLTTASDLAGIAIERHRSISALHDSEERFRSLAENIPGTVYLCRNDERYTMTYLNDAVEELTGYPAHDFLDDRVSFVELYHPDDAERIRERVEEALAKKEPYDLTYRIRHRDGHWRWIHEIGAGVFRDGELAFLEGFLHDVTEFRRSERELAHANQMLQIVLDTIPVRVFWKDDQLFYLGCNRVFAQDAAARDPGELIGKNDYELAWKEQADRYRADDRRVIETARPILNYEEPQATPTGETIWLKTSKVPLRDVDGEIMGVLGTYEDITEQKRTEQALRESEERFRTMVEHAPEAIVVYDVDANRFIDVNDNACTMFRCDRSRLLSIGPFDLTPPVKIDGRPAHQIARERIQEALAGEAPTFEYVHCDVEGNEFPCEIRLVRMPPYTRRLLRGSLTDITDRKEAERRQAFLIDELDHRVKNNLAAVLALTSQTLATCNTLEEFGEIFSGRIEALARTHELLAASRWRGVNVRNLVRMILEPSMLPGRKGIDYEGPDVMLPARASGPLTMTLHELMTNSLKHGSLSAPTGRLRVTWSFDSDRGLRLRWTESDGPAVREPERTGLGVRLIRGFVEHELGGVTRLEFNPSGLVCYIEIPLDEASDSGSARAGSTVKETPA